MKNSKDWANFTGSKKHYKCRRLYSITWMYRYTNTFREPGSTDTEDLHSGSRAAIAGGITSVFEMPNTNPPTSNLREFQRKLDLAKNRMYCNHGFILEQQQIMQMI